MRNYNNMYYNQDRLRRTAGVMTAGVKHRKSTRISITDQARMGGFILIAGVILAGIIIGLLFVPTISSKASSAYLVEERYKSVCISPGETLWDIADEYADTDSVSVSSYIHKVKNMNHLQGDTIHSGAYLTVPYYIKFKK